MLNRARLLARAFLIDVTYRNVRAKKYYQKRAQKPSVPKTGSLKKMKPVLKAILFLAIIFLSTLSLAQNQQDQNMQHCDLHFSNGVIFHQIPVARSHDEQAHGLSNRSDVGNGMLFAWSDEQKRTFWMHETHVPLSIGFFDQHGKLLSIKNMKPDSDELHHSEKPAQYALELPLWAFEKYHLTPGIYLKHMTCEQKPSAKK